VATPAPATQTAAARNAPVFRYRFPKVAYS